MQSNRSPILGAHQAHPVRVRDRSAAAVTALPEAGPVPELDGVLVREVTGPEPLSNDVLSDDVVVQRVQSHIMAVAAEGAIRL